MRDLTSSDASHSDGASAVRRADEYLEQEGRRRTGVEGGRGEGRVVSERTVINTGRGSSAATDKGSDDTQFPNPETGGS